MKDNRRNFLKLTSLTGLGLAGGIMNGFAKETERTVASHAEDYFGASQFNMSGYAAPKLEKCKSRVYWTWPTGPYPLK